MGRAGILDAYRTGKGSIKVRAKAEIEEGPRSDRIVVTSLPYQVSPNALLTKIKELVDSRELEGIADVNDESPGKTGMRIVIKLKRDAPAPASSSTTCTSARRCRPTSRSTRWPWSTACPARSTCARPWWPTSTTRSRSSPAAPSYRLDKAQRAGPHRRGPAQGPRPDRRRSSPPSGPSEDQPAAKAALMAEPFEFSEIQAEHILDMHAGAPDPAGPGRPRGGAGRAARHHRRARGHPGRRRQAARRHQGRDRRDPREVRHRPPVRDHLRRRATSTSRTSSTTRTWSSPCRPRATSRRWRPTPSAPRAAAVAAWPGAKLRDEDYVNHIIHTTAHAYLLFFSNLGRVYRLKAHEIPMKERTARGTAIVNLLPLQPGETHPGHHRHPRLRDQPVPVLRHPQGSGQEDQVHRVRLVAAGRPHRHQPARRRRAGQGHPHQRRRRHLHGQPRRA